MANALYKKLLIVLMTALAYSAQAQFFNELYNKDTLVQSVDGETEVYFVGAADVQVAISEKKDLSASTGFGTLFWRIWRTNIELQLDAKINVASTVDTVESVFKNVIVEDRRKYGSLVLTPLTSGQSLAINALVFFQDPKIDTQRQHKWNRIIDGVNFSVVASNQVWKINYIHTHPATGRDSISAIKANNASTIAWRIGVFHEFIPEDLRRRKGYSIRFGANFIGRTIQGDLGRATFRDLRNEILGTRKKTFYGGELLLALQLRNLRAEAFFPILKPKNSNESVYGLTGMQFVTTISFAGGFPVDLKPNSFRKND